MSPHPHRLELSVALVSRQREDVPGARRPRTDDLLGLATLMFAAYQGTVDYTGESADAAAEEVQKTFAGGYGIYLPQHSYVVERNSALVAASLVTRLDDTPLLAFAMTAPSWKRTGLARATIGNVMLDLHEAGETQLALVVNSRNQPALDLYLSLGFKPAQ
jgi:ribosomal protein S18 acetylase RimI-like enzyme